MAKALSIIIILLLQSANIPLSEATRTQKKKVHKCFMRICQKNSLLQFLQGYAKNLYTKSQLNNVFLMKALKKERKNNNKTFRV